MSPSSQASVLLLTLVKAHLHGGSYDPNVVNVSLPFPRDLLFLVTLCQHFTVSAAAPSSVAPSARWCLYSRQFCRCESSIPLATVLSCPNVSDHDMCQSYPNQAFTHPYQQQPVSPPTSPLSAQSSGYQVPVGQQQPYPLGQVQHQNTMQYQQQQQQQPMVCLGLVPDPLASLTVTGLWWTAGRLSATRTRQWTAGRNNGKALPWLLLRIGTELNFS